MENIFLGKQTCTVTIKLTSKAKDAITQICAAREINESQYIRLAIQNQMKADELALNPKQEQL